ncbi:PREDICTED: endonuclease 8-like 1 isoform X1 [Myotis davidii]|uniref:endonuclease 8-like 1 isoform X1 n=1 Tax=Myotis davidii TaxID=225400 RepID=UPI0007674897|nr:PREDICTED: endonuclease 8-like 1 isoform X1 [Myotis davidii]
MPEGPELHLASQFVNEACRGLVFGGCVEKSPISRNPEVPFESSAYYISASARGKELRLTLSPLPGAQPPQEPVALIFHFGMSGSFQLVPSNALPPHAHLRFYTAPPGPQFTLCFVDIRRFGHWELTGEWQPGRGPCVLLEYEQFRPCPSRENVLRNLADKVFDRPICEALLDQRFFNGIGNYLRAEILYRLRIPPFEKARTVLEALKQHRLAARAMGKREGRRILHPFEPGCSAMAYWACAPCGTGTAVPSGSRGILDLWHPKGASPIRRNPAEHSGVLRMEWRIIHPQARPLPGHEGHGEAFLSKQQPSSLRGPASKTQKSPQSLRKGRGEGEGPTQVGLPEHFPLEMEGAPPNGAFQKERMAVRAEVTCEKEGCPGNLQPGV